MAQKAALGDQEKPLLFNPMPEEFVATAKKRMEDFATAQTELFAKCQDANRHWLNRIQVEANMASDFAAKLTAARSIPEAVTACQEWGGRRLELMAEDAQQFLSDTQKFTQAGLRLIVNGRQSTESGVST
jgi:Phasin protein